MIEFIKNLIPIITLVSHFLIALLVLLLFFKNSILQTLVTKYAVPAAFVVALTATLGSLFYSDVLGYNPCKFCWFQRIFMYPLVIIIAMAWKYKEVFVRKYILMMSAIGGLISLNHYILQTTGTSIFPCSAIGQSVACNKVFVMHYGYITIPMMALSAFILIILFMLHARRPL